MLEETGLLPHANPGCSPGTRAGPQARLGLAGDHAGAGLRPAARPRTSPTGPPPTRCRPSASRPWRRPDGSGALHHRDLIGIGETVENGWTPARHPRGPRETRQHSRVHSPELPGQASTRMAAGWSRPRTRMLATIALARLLLPPTVAVQAPRTWRARRATARPPTPATRRRHQRLGRRTPSPRTTSTRTPLAPPRECRGLQRPRATCSSNASRSTLLRQDAGTWVDERLRPGVWPPRTRRASRGQRDWAPGTTEPIPPRPLTRSAGYAPRGTAELRAGARGGRDPRPARGGDSAALHGAGD